VNEESIKIAGIDPRDYFNYEACKRCDFLPCRRLLFRGACYSAYGRDFVIAHSGHYSTIDPCAFAVPSFDEAESFLNKLSIQEINGKISRLRKDLDVAETFRYPANHYLTDWADFAEKIEYLRVLWRDRVYALIRVPFQPEEKIAWWIQAFRESFSGLTGENDAATTPDKKDAAEKGRQS
jgi:hypothetical protein